jgi:hypothetical protein
LIDPGREEDAWGENLFLGEVMIICMILIFFSSSNFSLMEKFFSQFFGPLVVLNLPC